MSYIHDIGMKSLLKSLKNTFLIILCMPGHFRPIPTIDCINKIRKNHKKSPKLQVFNNRYFTTWWPKIWFLARNTPNKPRKVFQNHIETLFDNISNIYDTWKKNRFFHLKITHEPCCGINLAGRKCPAGKIFLSTN